MPACLNRLRSAPDPSRATARLALVLLAGLAVAACRKPEPPPVAATPAHAAPADRLATGPAGEAQAQGRDMLRAGRVPEAIASLGEAARLAPEVASVHRDLAEAFSRTRDWQRAAASAREAVRLDPADASAWIVLGSIEYSVRDFASSEASFLRATEADAARADAHDWLGSARYAQRTAALGGDNVDRAKVQQAIAAFERASQLAPAEPDYRLRLGLARRTLHDLAGAERELREAVRLGGRPEARMHLGEVLLESGQVEPARVELAAAIAAKPGLVRALVEMGRLELGAGDAAAAKAQLEKAVELDPLHAQARFQLAQALRRLGDEEGAARHQAEFDRLNAADLTMQSALGDVSRRPNDAQAHLTLGQLREAGGDRQGAVESYGRAIELDPKLLAARVNFGGMLLDAGQPALALPHLRAAVELDPQSPQAQINLGLALERTGDTRGAVAAYETAQRLAPQDASIAPRIERAKASGGAGAAP